MADIIKNASNGTVVIHATANATLTIAGNNSVSNVAVGEEIVTGAHIKQVWYGSNPANGGYWTVSRGSNVVAVYDSTGWCDYAGNGFGLIKDKAGTLVLTLENVADGEGYIMLEIKKELG